MHSGGQRVEAGHTFGNQRWFLLLIATDQPPSPLSASQAWLQSRFGNYIRLHGVWWGVTMGLKLLFHLTLCNLLSSHQCWHHQTSELLHITKCRHWDGYFSRFAEQETVSGDLITIHHMLSLTDTEIYSEKDLDTKHSGHWPHRSSHKQTGVWIIPSPQQIISAEYKSQLKLKCWLLWCSQEGTNQSTLNITGGKSWETSIVLNGVFIDIFNFPPICRTMLY